MSPDHDVYRRVGRGGAGNYYPSKQHEADGQHCDQVRAPNAVQFQRLLTHPPPPLTSQQDLEAQALSGESYPTEVAPPPDAISHGLARSGRGGAGNFLDASQLPGPDEQERMASQAATIMCESLQHNQARGGLAGRGGAGNFQSAGDKDRQEDGKTGKVEEVERRVREVVDKGLRIPEKVHQGNQKMVG